MWLWLTFALWRPTLLVTYNTFHRSQQGPDDANHIVAGPPIWAVCGPAFAQAWAHGRAFCAGHARCDILTPIGRKVPRALRGTGFMVIRKSALEKIKRALIGLDCAVDTPQSIRLRLARRFQTCKKSRDGETDMQENSRREAHYATTCQSAV